MSTDTRTDAEVIAASWDDLEEFGIIFQRHHDAVFAFVARRFYRTEAADLTSLVFIKAIGIRHRYKTDRGNALPWLYGIAANVIGDRLRKERRARNSVFPGPASDRNMDSMQDSDERLVASDVAADLRRALAKLTTGQREALLLSALEGLSYTEIAEAQRVSSRTVGSRLTRARATILECLPDLRQEADRGATEATEEERG